MGMRRGAWALGVTAILLSCAGCALDVDSPEEATREAEQALARANGIELNGIEINGTYMNGIKMNGIKMNGIKMNGIKMNGTSLEGTLEDTGATVTGAAFAGADMDAVLGDSTVTQVHVESASTSDVPGLITYLIKQNDVGICGNDGQGNPIKAFALEGTWNYATGSFVPSTDQFTLACRGAALAKCVEFGYQRWGSWNESNGSTSQSVPFRYFHEACVRMVRADYCGNGVPHTVNGTTIDIWDAAGIQTQTPNSGLLPEAEWSSSGATCIKRARWTTADGLNVQQYIQDTCPSRWAPTSTSCMGNAAAGSPFFTVNGFGVALETRPLLRNASAQN